MKASPDDASRDKGRDEGWDETVLVWNATVARIPAPAVQPDAAQDVTGVEGGNATSDRRARGRAPGRRPDSNRGPVDHC
jgi:hypothetical protein